jgi:hypothetical protein
MRPESKHRDSIPKGPMLTIEDIEAQECFKNLSLEQKISLISLVHDISLALYHSYFSEHEQS